MPQAQIILGIDPGTNIMGFGVIRVLGSKIETLDMGTVSMQKIKDPYQKMAYILEQMYVLLDKFMPDYMAIEAPFYGKNVQSMLKLGRAQGVAIAAALSRQVPVCEYAPRKVKLAITGRGAASKEQVAQLLQSSVHFEQEPTSWDATDALAIAVCHAYQMQGGGLPTTTKQSSKGKSWAAFVAGNPDRVVKK